MLNQIRLDSWNESILNILSEGVLPSTLSIEEIGKELCGINWNLATDFVADPCRWTWKKFSENIRYNGTDSLPGILTVLIAAIQGKRTYDMELKP